MDTKNSHLQPNQPNPQPGGAPYAPQNGVMDVQRPKFSQPVAAAPAASSPHENLSQESVPEALASSDNEVQAAPPAEAAAPVSSAPFGGVADAAPAPAQHHELQAPSSHELLTAHVARQKKPHNLPVVSIVVALMIGLSLMALAVFVYMRTQDDEHASQGTTHNTTEQMPSTAAPTPQDVDTASQSVDEALNAAEAAQDMPESELSDQNLGL